MQIFPQILDEHLLTASLCENWWLQTSDTIRLALAASSIHKAAATEYGRRVGAERRTQRASSRRKPCVEAALLPHAAPRGVPPPPQSTVAVAASNAAHSALPAAVVCAVCACRAATARRTPRRAAPPPPLSRLWARCQSMTKDKSVLESLWDFIRTIDYAKGWNFTSLPT